MRYKTLEQLKKLPGVSIVEGRMVKKGSWWTIGPEDYGQPVPESVQPYVPGWLIIHSNTKASSQ
jgi:hypothetical protein